MKRIEKVEVTKGYGNYFYTGYVEELGDWVRITTIKGEVVTFRKEQVLQRVVVNEMKGVNDDKKP